MDEWKIGLIVAGAFIFVVLHFPCFWFIFRKLFPRKKEIQLNTIVINNVTIIQPEQVTLGESIGKGHFGEVKRGKWNATDIAVKRVTPGTQMDEEARILSEINHPHIVRIYGVFPQLDFMVMEFCNLGSLREFLHIGGFSAAEKRKMCVDVCKGMQFVAQKGIVHRDLAARNVLVVGTRERFDLKISDFGMSREGDSYYSEDRTIPYRWSAPEVFTHLKFSQASDVWSFGVVCWEIYEEGKVPYHGLTNGQVHDEVLKGKRLECPSSCDPDMWRIISDCFKENPKERQNFKQILALLDPEDYSEVPKLKKQDSATKKKKRQSKTPQEPEPVQVVEIKKEPVENDYEMKTDDYERSKDDSESSSSSEDSDDDEKSEKGESSTDGEYNTTPKVAKKTGNDSSRAIEDRYKITKTESEDHYNTDAPTNIDSNRAIEDRYKITKAESEDHYNTDAPAKLDSRRTSEDHYNTDQAPPKKEASSSEDEYNTSPKPQKKNIKKESSSSSDEDSSSSDSEDEYNTGPQLPKKK